jgi:hypothetical protein
VVADVIVVINPSTRGFAMSSGERQPRDHAVISSPPQGMKTAHSMGRAPVKPNEWVIYTAFGVAAALGERLPQEEKPCDAGGSSSSTSSSGMVENAPLTSVTMSGATQKF